MLPLAAVGLWRAPPGTRPAALLTLAASSVAVCLVFFPQERFRLPVVDPTLLAGAALARRPPSRPRRISCHASCPPSPRLQAPPSRRPRPARPPTLVLIPTYNERENLPVLVRDVVAHPGFRVMVVDDRSPDGTGEVADELARELPGRVEVLHRTGKKGLGRSYIEALLLARERTEDFVCQMDADLSHDPKYLPDDGGDGARRHATIWSSARAICRASAS